MGIKTIVAVVPARNISSPVLFGFVRPRILLPEQVIKELGNPELANLKATHNVLGIEHFINEVWNWKLEGYYKSLDDLVVSTDSDQHFLNEGSGKAYGLELLVKWNPIKKFSGWLSLTYSRSERTNHLTNETFLYELDLLNNRICYHVCDS